MNRSILAISHFVIWTAVLALFIYVGAKGADLHTSLVVFGYFGLINVLVFYINYLVIIPSFLDKRMYRWFTAAVVILVLASAFVKCGLAYYFHNIVFPRGSASTSFWDYFASTVLVSCFFIFLSSILKFIVDWFHNEKVKSELENEKLTSELAFLKSQLNPHFLFNSLNNIYSLAYQGSDKTPRAILKLSEIMRYMLYESNSNVVSLSEEIRYLENFIELQKLRFKDEVQINFTISGTVDGQMITPLVLISFVDNAFKHGIATDREHPISVALSVDQKELHFQVINRKSNQNKDVTGGIGLQNLQRRMDLLYAGRYSIDLREDAESYNCELYLILSDDTMPGRGRRASCA